MALLDLPTLLTFEQAASFLRMDVLEVRRAAAAGDLPLVRSGERCFVDTRCLLLELGVALSPCAAPQLSLLQEPEPQTGDEAQRHFTCWRGAS
jgi:hypothetical protein